jgi:hypothetical protein
MCKLPPKKRSRNERQCVLHISLDRKFSVSFPQSFFADFFVQSHPKKPMVASSLTGRLSCTVVKFGWRHRREIFSAATNELWWTRVRHSENSFFLSNKHMYSAHFNTYMHMYVNKEMQVMACYKKMTWNAETNPTIVSYDNIGVHKNQWHNLEIELIIFSLNVYVCKYLLYIWNLTAVFLV